jgi:hypothetical protein
LAAVEGLCLEYAPTKCHFRRRFIKIEQLPGRISITGKLDMHSVRSRQVQGVNWVSSLHGLSVKLQLACGERIFDELHL